MSTPHRNMAESLCKGIYKRSADPRAPENALDPDWQAGFLFGKLTEAKDSGEDIHAEWQRRGSPEPPYSTEFKSWKAGYWAGRFTRLEATRESKP